MSDPTPLVGAAKARASRGALAVHDHVCGLYETRAEQDEATFRFLEAGLEREEQCLYISEHDTPAKFTARLSARSVNATKAIQNGSLLVVSGEEMRHAIGGFTPDAMFEFLATAEKKALATGFAAFRWAGEMTWLQKPDIALIEVFKYEARLNQFLREHKAVAFCQYAMAEFRPEVLIAAAETHPLLVYENAVCDNFYYIPPEEYLKPGLPSVKLKRILFNIITRERLMQTFLS